MLTTLRSIQFTRDVLVPGWILVFGFAALNAPVMGIAASLSMFVVGVIVVPTILILRPGAISALAVEPATRA